MKVSTVAFLADTGMQYGELKFDFFTFSTKIRSRPVPFHGKGSKIFFNFFISTL
jgi:hypothetical protein